MPSSPQATEQGPVIWDHPNIHPSAHLLWLEQVPGIVRNKSENTPVPSWSSLARAWNPPELPLTHTEHIPVKQAVSLGTLDPLPCHLKQLMYQHLQLTWAGEARPPKHPEASLAAWQSDQLPVRRRDSHFT